MNLPTTLAIDTSCDETSVSVVQGLTVLSNIQATQFQYHKKYGGVVPSLAKLAHQERIDNVVEEALKRAFPVGSETFPNLQNYMNQIDNIAVTIGPGLAIALEVGILKAKKLAKEFDKPLVVINHMEGHLFSGFAVARPKSVGAISLSAGQAGNHRYNSNQKRTVSNLLNSSTYPALGLLVSGKHTEIVLVNGVGEYKIIGETLDDACGEAFDKAGRMLGLGYPAGPVVAKFAKEHRKNMKIEVLKKSQAVHVRGTNRETGASYELPVAMAYSDDSNFSYSGLKTAVKQLVEKLNVGAKTSFDSAQDDKSHLQSDPGLTKQQILDLCVVFEEAAFEPIVIKLERLLDNRAVGDQALGHLQVQGIKSLWLGGGVAANTNLKTKLRRICRRYNLEFVYPKSKKLTTDNAAMIGLTANLKIMKAKKEKIDLEELSWYYKADSDLDAIDRDPSLGLG